MGVKNLISLHGCEKPIKSVGAKNLLNLWVGALIVHNLNTYQKMITLKKMIKIKIKKIKKIIIK
jgi:hypothetical protein